MLKIIKNLDKKLLIVTIILFALGVVMIYSSSNVTAYMADALPSAYFVRQLFFIFAGLIISFVILKFNTKSYSLISWLATIAIAIILLCLFLYGTAVNGVYGWIGYKGFGIQPSEFVKVSIIVLLATYYDQNKNYGNDLKRMLIPLGVVFVITLFIVLQKDLGTAFIFLILSLGIFFMSPTSKKIKLSVFFLGLFSVIALVLVLLVGGDKVLASNKLDRFNFARPCERYLDSGNQLCNAYIAINGGGLLGKGLGNSTQKYLYLPESHTDFIFAIFAEECGLVGIVLLFCLYIFLLFRIVVTGSKTDRVLYRLICYGVALYLFLHIIINLGGVMGIIPITGVPLAFISYGGSFCWCTIIALTLVQRVQYEMKMQKNVKN